MSRLVFKNVTKTYPSGVCAVKDFNLSIDAGELVVFFGPSESAKSTLVRMVAGIEDVSSGTILIDDKVLNDIDKKDREIAFISQSFTLFPTQTVYDNISYGLRLRKVPEDVIKDKVTVVAEILGLTESLNKKAKQLSAVDKQRVAFGRAIVREPKVIIFDEPYSNLDKKTREIMRSEIVKLHKRLNSTIIYASKDTLETLTIADRVVVLNEGFIQQVDKPENIYNYPSNFYTAALIGDPQMNTFIGFLSKTENGTFATFGKRRIQIDENTVKRIVDFDSLEDTTEVSFGIRYEDTKVLSTKEIGDKAGYSMDCVVISAEKVGKDTQVYCAIAEDVKDADTMIVKASADKDFQKGDKIDVYFDTKYLQIFDVNTGKKMLKRDEGFIIDDTHQEGQDFEPLTPQEREELFASK